MEEGLSSPQAVSPGTHTVTDLAIAKSPETVDESDDLTLNEDVSVSDETLSLIVENSLDQNQQQVITLVEENSISLVALSSESESDKKTVVESQKPVQEDLPTEAEETSALTTTVSESLVLEQPEEEEEEATISEQIQSSLIHEAIQETTVYEEETSPALETSIANEVAAEETYASNQSQLEELSNYSVVFETPAATFASSIIVDSSQLEPTFVETPTLHVSSQVPHHFAEFSLNEANSVAQISVSIYENVELATNSQSPILNNQEESNNNASTHVEASLSSDFPTALSPVLAASSDQLIE